MLAALQSACARHAERRGVSTRHATVVCALFGLALLARLLLFGVAPRGINQDEAYAAYEAWSLLHFGVDSWGYHNPVYLVAWGSGMNALETYLSMPLVALMGLNIMAVRIPQLVVSLCSVLCLEDLVLRATGSEREAEVAMGMLAICPWSIMSSHWGLESNLAPGFMLFATWAFWRAFDRPAWWIGAGVLYGLCAYAYAIVWMAIPVALALQIGLALHCGKRFPLRDARLWIGLAALVVLVLPLVLFVLVGLGIMPEVRSCISIPRMRAFRSGEVGFSAERLVKLIRLVVFQEAPFPILNLSTTPLWLLGIWTLGGELKDSVVGRALRGEAVIAPLFAASLFASLMVDPNVNRVNLLWIPLTALSAHGLMRVFVRWNSALIRRVVMGVFAVGFMSFEVWYGTTYLKEEGSLAEALFFDGVAEAIRSPEAQGAPELLVDASIPYSVVLFADQTTPDVLRAGLTDDEDPNFSAFATYQFVPSEDMEQRAHSRPMALARCDTSISVWEDLGYRAIPYGDYLLMIP